MTREIARVNSPATCSANISGKKNKIVVADELSKGKASSLPP